MLTISRTRRFSLVATLLLSLVYNAASAITAQEIADRAQPSALLTTEMNRRILTEGILAAWAREVEKADAEFTRKKLSAALEGLRADHLLLASMAKSANALLDILTTAVVRDAPPTFSGGAKALGSTTQDLVFTPVAPCRMLDTRLVGGPWVPGVERTYNGFTGTNFTAQGGAGSNCGVPNGVAALAIEAIAVSPPADGWFFLWPGNIPQPATSTFNYGPALSAITFGTILPVNNANSNQFKANSSQSTHLIVDVVGYFAAPSGGVGAGQVGTASIVDGAVTNAKLAVGSLPQAIFTFGNPFTSTILTGMSNEITSPSCPAGSTAISGNCSASDNATFLWGSFSNGSTWACRYSNRGAFTATVQVQALCLSAPAAAK